MYHPASVSALIIACSLTACAAPRAANWNRSSSCWGQGSETFAADYFREAGRQRCLNLDSLSRDRVLKVQKLRVQEIPSVAREAREIFERLTGRTVQRIAYQRMADRCQMDPDLMRAARM